MMKDKIQVNLRGEIIAAKNFDANNLFIAYCFLLPDGWVCGDNKQTCGITQCSSTSQGVATFNHLCDLPLWLTPASGPSLSLVLEVTSLDTWSRFRTEGYSLVNVPLSPGRMYLKVTSWRPLPDLQHSHAARVADMRRFFIGGNPQLRDMGAHLATSQSGAVLSRAGLRAESSGEIELSFDCILQQSNVHVLPSSSDLKHVVTSVDQVILAYTKVQARMARVREDMRLDMEAH